MNIEEIFTVLTNECIADGVYRMTLYGNCELIVKPGQFVNIKIPGLFLRRPISVCDCENDILTLIYKAVGKGTDAMSLMKAGTKLNILTGLGNGFDVTKSGDQPLLIGGGVGTPPMYGLAKKLVAEGKKVNVILGFASEKDVFYIEEFKKLNGSGAKGSCSVYAATVDGSFGTKGFVTDCFDKLDGISHFYACGPIPMLKALITKIDACGYAVKGQLSFEERMGCGFGACVGCSMETKTGIRKVCKDGPVFMSDEINL